LKIKNWVGVYKRRSKTLKQNLTTKKHIIENCPEMDFLCPLNYEDLENLGKYKQRYCNQCKKNVYQCGNEIELMTHVEKGHCVTFIYAERRFLGRVTF
jgi:hypothetical protein